MSDPAKSAHEIEDVLASIRRLVSEGGPVTATISPARSSVAPVDAAPMPATHTRLVLTPALRVMDPDDPWAPVPLKGQDALGADPADPSAADGEDDPAWGLEDRLADWGEIEESGAESVADAIAEQSADPHLAPPRPGAVENLDDLDDLDDSETLADFEAETGDANWPDRSAGTALRDLALVRGQGARDEGAATPTPDGAASLTLQDGATPMATDDPTPAQDASAPSDRVFSRRLNMRRSDATIWSDEDDDQDGDQPDLDGDVEDLGEATSPFTFPETDAEDGVLDEETLRDIIAEVVRQELQGALGQRITRNVRKMVRREVRMALAAEDLE